MGARGCPRGEPCTNVLTAAGPAGWQKRGLDRTLCLEGTAGLWGRGEEPFRPPVDPLQLHLGGRRGQVGGSLGLGAGGLRSVACSAVHGADTPAVASLGYRRGVAERGWERDVSAVGWSRWFSPRGSAPWGPSFSAHPEVLLLGLDPRCGSCEVAGVDPSEHLGLREHPLRRLRTGGSRVQGASPPRPPGRRGRPGACSAPLALRVQRVDGL